MPTSQSNFFDSYCSRVRTVSMSSWQQPETSNERLFRFRPLHVILGAEPWIEQRSDPTLSLIEVVMPSKTALSNASATLFRLTFLPLISNEISIIIPSQRDCLQIPRT